MTIGGPFDVTHNAWSEAMALDGNGMRTGKTNPNYWNQRGFYKRIDETDFEENIWPAEIESLHNTLDRYKDDKTNPAHYRWLPVECIEITERFNFNLGNVLKYVMRCDHKGQALEDLKKARWYLDREIERRGK